MRHLAIPALILALGCATPSLAQTAAGETSSTGQSEEMNGDRGAADPESVFITLGTQATEIRQILMAAGEVDAEAVPATERARELATQAIETTGILLPDQQDTQVTTTRRSDVQQARDLFTKMEEMLEVRLAALAEGDDAEANRARLAVIQSINELPEDIRFEGDVAEGDNPTSDPGGAQPILQQ